MKFDFYFYRARLWPALLTSIPGLIFINRILVPMLGPGLREILSVIPWVAHFGLSFALIFLLIQINRFLAKEIFQRCYFKEERNMPSTNFLLWKDSFFDEQVKVSLINKIHNKFNISIPDRISEASNELKSREIIVSAVSQIRIILEGNRMLFRHNIEYGFIRNLLGGCLMAVLFSALLYIVGVNNQQPGLTTVGSMFTIIYLIPLLISQILLRRYGKYYAKILYEQFLAIQ